MIDVAKEPLTDNERKKLIDNTRSGINAAADVVSDIGNGLGNIGDVIKWIGENWKIAIVGALAVVVILRK